MLTLLWDNDGVLVDSERLFYQATSHALGYFDIELTETLFKTISLREGRSTFDLARERGISEDAIANIRDIRDQNYSEILRERELLLPGVKETLETLSGTVGMGIVTSARRMHFDAAHHRSGILSHFAFTLTREDYQQSKPHPEPYLTALDRFALKAEDCLVIEDSERGLASAVAAGLRCVAVPNELTAQGDFTTAHRVLADIRELPQTVRELQEC